jgi:ABC-type sugar transport system permease subunit
MFNDQYGTINAILQDRRDGRTIVLAKPQTAMVAVILAMSRRFSFVLIAARRASDIPAEMYEAEVDGGNAWHRFRYVTCRPAAVRLSCSDFSHCQAFAIFDLGECDRGGPGGVAKQSPLTATTPCDI